MFEAVYFERNLFMFLPRVFLVRWLIWLAYVFWPNEQSVPNHFRLACQGVFLVDKCLTKVLDSIGHCIGHCINRQGDRAETTHACARTLNFRPASRPTTDPEIRQRFIFSP